MQSPQVTLLLSGSLPGRCCLVAVAVAVVVSLPVLEGGAEEGPELGPQLLVIGGEILQIFLHQLTHGLTQVLLGNIIMMFCFNFWC